MTLDYTYVTIDVGDDTEPDPIDYALRVVDHYSGSPIEGAHVWITYDGTTSDKGYTDANGQVDLTNVVPGRTYELRITATDYQDSDADLLANDEITIPMPEA